MISGFAISSTASALAATLFSSLKDLTSKSLSARVDGTTSTLASFAYALPYYFVALVVFIALDQPLGDLSVNFWCFVFLRSITDAFAEWLKMSALTKADISLVAPFFALSPVFLLFLGPALSGDSISTLGTIGVLLSVIGTIGILPSSRSPKPSNKDQSHIDQRNHACEIYFPTNQTRTAILQALIASLFFSLNTLFDRLAVQQSSSLVSAAAMTAAATLPFIVPVIKSRDRRVAFIKESRLFNIRGLFEFAFMTLKLFALSSLPGAYVTGIMRLSGIGTIVGGRVMFQEKETKRRLFWGTVVCAGGILIIFSG